MERVVNQRAALSQDDELSHTKAFSKAIVFEGPQQTTHPVTIATAILGTFLSVSQR